MVLSIIFFCCITVCILIFKILTSHENLHEDKISAFILIAKNQEETIECRIRELLIKYPYAQIHIIDDNSSDETSDIIQLLSRDYGRIKVFSLKDYP